MFSAMSAADLNIASHLVRRFRERGVDCGFGIVGDFALRLFGALEDEGFPIHVTCDEQGAAFAADAYARLRGFGVAAATYGVGGLKMANAVAGAWAEQVPLLMLSGAPGVAERKGEPLLHHRVKDFDTQLRVYSDLTVIQEVLDNPHTAADQIDAVIARMISEQRPGYIEVPRDMVGVTINPPSGDLEISLPPVDSERLAAAVEDALEQLIRADRPVIIAGALAWRRGLGEHLKDFAEHVHIQVATSGLAKGFFPERHPLSLGVYMGAVSSEEVVERVEGADEIISFGVLRTDLNMGGFTANLAQRKMIEATDTDVTVGLRTYANVPLWAFLPALEEAARIHRLDKTPLPQPVHAPFAPVAGAPATVERVMAAVAAAIDDRHGLLVDPGECLFASVDLPAPAWSLASAYYATMGYAVPAALGAGKADSRRPVVLVGDGAFAMTGMEAAAVAFHGVPAIIVIVDNGGYGTQRPMLDGPFNDIPSLAAEHLPAVFGRGRGWLVSTEEELAAALAAAVASDQLEIVRVLVPRGLISPALARLTGALAKRV
jgi:indolepyruvate decarboxylase